MPKVGMTNLAPVTLRNQFLYQHFDRQYFRKVLSIDPQNLIGYWPQWEASGSVAYDLSPQGNDGAYTDVTLAQAGIGDGRSCPLFGGERAYNNVYSAAFNSDFSGAAGSISLWAKVSAAGVWEDGDAHSFIRLGADGNNRVDLLKATDNNRLTILYKAGGTSKSRNKDSISTTDFFQIGITWDKPAEEMKAYFNGVQVSTTLAALGTWLGNLAEANAVVGAASTVPAQPLSGYLAHPAVWKVALSAEQMLRLYQR